MLFKNARIFDGGRFYEGSFRCDGGRFTELYRDIPDGEGTDLAGAYVIPGLIDLHGHGNSGADFSDGDYEGLVRMARFLARNGVTSFAPASMTLPYDDIGRAVATAVRLSREQPEQSSRIAGIQMEGPFFSEKKKGAQNGAYLRLPDLEAFRRLCAESDGLLRIVDVAPELDGAIDFIRGASKLAKVSIAHTDASYEQTCAAIDAGASHLTHLFNAMPSIHHRDPGVIGAAAERESVTAELICDGLHVHESAVRIAFKLFPGRLCLISDALRCCGMPDGVYELGGQQARLSGKIARLPDGTIAGAASTLYDGMLNAISFGVPVAEAIRAATLVPARELGRDKELGSISLGKYADFIVCGSALDRRQVYIGGERIQ